MEKGEKREEKKACIIIFGKITEVSSVFTCPIFTDFY